MSQPDIYVTCRCQNCDKGIEFAAADLSDYNCIINCPHCSVQTRLSVPPVNGLPPSNGLQPSPGPLLLPPSLMTQTPPLPKALKLQWRDNELELAEDQVIVRRYDSISAFKFGTPGGRAIAIASITAIQVRHGDLLNAGRIIFLYPGSAETREDPDIFLFGMELNRQVDEFKNTVESIMRSMRQPLSVPASATLPDDIRKLAELRQQGLLSAEEFDAAKKKLLA